LLQVSSFVTLGLIGVLVASGLVLTWAYRPAPDGPELLRTVHRLASALLLPASWVLLFAMVRSRWGVERGATLSRWAVPALLLVSVPAAAFTGFLLPWEEVVVATAVVPPELRGMGVAFDASVSTISFGAAPITRAVFQRYVLAHLFVGVVVAALVVFVGRRSRVHRPR
jgi:quinol-cytochrome oxidoreductase complex cytochrome b subunit